MIRYNLTSKNNHEFERWFSHSLEFEKLNKKNLLECIHCNSKKIKKSIMSPSILNSNTNITHKNYDKNIKKKKKDLLKLRKFVEKNFEYVGDKLASNVRNIYYDKKLKKNIYGTTTKEERKQLREEGIELFSLPWIDKDN